MLMTRASYETCTSLHLNVRFMCEVDSCIEIPRPQEVVNKDAVQTLPVPVDGMVLKRGAQVHKVLKAGFTPAGIFLLRAGNVAKLR